MTGTASNEPRYDVVWPLGRSTAEQVAITERLPEPDGKRLGFIWDYVFRGDDIFAIAREALAKHHPGLNFVDHAAFGNIHGPDEQAVVGAIPDKLRAEEVDAVIVGVGA
jgi:hypothetical protein